VLHWKVRSAWLNCPMLLSKGILKYGHIRQVVTKYRFNWYKIYCDRKLILRSHITSYCLIEVVTKPGLTIIKLFLLKYSWQFFRSPSFAYSEDYQKDFIAEYHQTFDKIRHDYLAGEMIWNFADFYFRVHPLPIQKNTRRIL